MYELTKQGSESWADLKGKAICFAWSDGYDDPYTIRLIFHATQPYAEDLRYPRYYVVDKDGGGVSFWEHEVVTVTVEGQ